MPNTMHLPSVRRLTVTAMLMAVNIVFSSSILSVPVPGGHMYLNDMVVVLAGVLLDPLSAFVAGGVGAFLGDLFFYPTPMFVSLFVHGLQAVVLSLLLARGSKKREIIFAVLGATAGVLINVAGYSVGRAFLYSTPEYALLKLPFQILQACVGSALGVFLAYGCKLKRLLQKNNLI